MNETLFPSLDGGDPGSAEVSQDITGQVLPPLSAPPADPMAPAPADDGYPKSDIAQDVQVLSPVPQYDVSGQPAAPGQDVAVVDGTPHQPPQEPRRRSLKDRIGTLTRQRNAEREGRGLAEQQLEQLTNALLAQGEQLNQLAQGGRTPAQPPVVNQPDPLTGETPPAVPGHAASTITPEQIGEIVSREINNYDQRLRTQNAETVRLQQLQDDSYNAAVEEIPALGDPNSPVAKTFAELWNRSPLRTMEDGPYQVALQVLGLVSEEQANTQQLTQRKRQASITNPQPTATDTLGEGQKAALAKEYQRLSATIRAGNRDPDLLFKFRKIGRALGRTGPRR